MERRVEVTFIDQEDDYHDTVPHILVSIKTNKRTWNLNLYEDAEGKLIITDDRSLVARLFSNEDAVKG